jgi:hypothetical protein
VDNAYVIWLEPTCPDCECVFAHYDNSVGRSWCKDRLEDCEECGRPWVKYELSLDQPLDTEEADD